MGIPQGLSYLWPEELCTRGCGLRELKNRRVSTGNTHQEARPQLQPRGWWKFKQEVKGKREHITGCCQPAERCKVNLLLPSAGGIFMCVLPTSLWEDSSRSTNTGSPPRLGVQFSSLQFTTQVVTKANIKALQFANYRRDPGLVGPINHLFLIFCVWPADCTHNYPLVF